jgi:hypothetical protein
MHLQTDEASRKLGFDKGALLRLSQWDSPQRRESFELTDSSWEHHLLEIQPVDHQGMFRVFNKDSVEYIQENHYYEPSRSQADANVCPSIDKRTKSRIDALAKLLHQP